MNVETRVYLIYTLLRRQQSVFLGTVWFPLEEGYFSCPRVGSQFYSACISCLVFLGKIWVL